MHRIRGFGVPRAHEVPLAVKISGGHHTNLHDCTLVFLSRRIRHIALKGASFRFCCNLASCLTTSFLFSLEDPPLIGGCLHCLLDILWLAVIVIRNRSECAAPLIQLITCKIQRQVVFSRVFSPFYKGTICGISMSQNIYEC